MTEYALPNWQRAIGEPVLTCRIKKENADFQLSERLGFGLSGDGEHDFLQIEKEGANTSWVASGLARFAAIAVSDVGFAGLKDRHAVTTQWFSVRRPAGHRADWLKLDLEGVRVLQVDRHRRKLRRGAHLGNDFRIALRNLTETGGGLRERLMEVRDGGVPNYFGEQRFGHDGGNLALARDLFAGQRLSRGKRSIALSAARSFLFNQILQERVRNGTWNTLLPGDCASLDGSGSFFSVAGIDSELERRSDELDIHPSGALWGAGDLQTAAKVAESEETVVDRFPEFMQGLVNKRVQQARRALRLAVRSFTWERDGDTMWLRFFLTRGGFATAVLREIANYEI
ncbi:MAG: tRNA pseudouridine(13) synthase TruD [Gammaproteobacteria bacterium]|nr:MAG: tRNA pseudouridine(13) synthase TruD [Gammaproteobacteria bacterium]